MPAKGVGRGYNNRTVFSPRRVGSIGRDRQILVIRRRDVSKFFVKAESFPQTLLYFHPPASGNPLILFFLSLSLSPDPCPRSRVLLLLLFFAFNRIILTRLCFIRAARSVCSGITSTQGKKNQTLD